MEWMPKEWRPWWERCKASTRCLWRRKWAPKSWWRSSADVEARDARGRTALMVASEHGFAGIVTALLAADAKPELVNKDNKTALMLACARGHGRRRRRCS